MFANTVDFLYKIKVKIALLSYWSSCPNLKLLLLFVIREHFWVGCHDTTDVMYVALRASYVDGTLVNYQITNPPRQTWFHLAFTWDLSSRTLSVYVDGDIIGTDTVASGSTPLLTAQGIFLFFISDIHDM